MIFIVLPAYNEAENLPRLFNEIREIMDESSYQYSVVLVDDGSSDDTLHVARQEAELMPVEICQHEQNKGLAETLKTGLIRAVELSADRDIIVTMDADSTHTPGLVLRMVRMVREGYDVVIASRYRPGSRVIGVPMFRKFLSYGASIMFRVLFPFRGVKDYTCGYRAYRASVIKKMFSDYGDDFISESGFSCMVDILLKMRKYGVILGEAPMILRYDQKEGESKMKVGKTIVQTLRLVFRRFFETS